MTGLEIRSVREHLSLSQALFGMLLGVHAVTVSRWETGSQSPTAYQIGLIQEFGRAARRRNGADIATILVTEGAIAGLFFLLRKAREKGAGDEPG